MKRKTDRQREMSEKYAFVEALFLLLCLRLRFSAPALTSSSALGHLSAASSSVIPVKRQVVPGDTLVRDSEQRTAFEEPVTSASKIHKPSFHPEFQADQDVRRPVAEARAPTSGEGLTPEEIDRGKSKF